jgi:small subunit ribosomal protein S16
MALKIRLRKQGRNNRPFYRVVLTNARTPRDGKYIEALGWYNPLEKEQEHMFNIHADRVQYWVGQGAEISESVTSLLANGAPAIVKQMTARNVLRRAHALKKRKARKASS